MPRDDVPDLTEHQHELVRLASRLAPACEHWSLRLVSETSEHLESRQNIVSAPTRSLDRGLMVSVAVGPAQAWAASPDESAAGLGAAFERAAAMAKSLQKHFPPAAVVAPPAGISGSYRSPLANPIPPGLDERIDAVRAAGATLKIDDRIVDWQASLSLTSSTHLFVTGDLGPMLQNFEFVVPQLVAVARTGDRTRSRSLAGQYNGYCRQGGWEILQTSGFADRGREIAEQALELTQAPNCPTAKMDLLLMPDQMMLQIHESIGHPLELDRILGDERNFAGTSFVTPEMFGNYQYGSDLLNVSYAPDVAGQFASFAFDDEGMAAERTMLIERGRLLRPLGGQASAARATGFAEPVQPVATTRACSWNRAPIDRMSNLNIEPGESSIDAMIASVELGVLMQTNASWSIDDSRNKFQFGCEYGRMIRDGKLAEVVRNPNYRGMSASFWRSLAMVGNAASVETLGTPFCGKGEPMQVIRVGHASPACLFRQIDVFGGQA